MPDASGSKAAVAGQLRGVAVADPQATRFLHRPVDRPDPMGGGVGLGNPLVHSLLAICSSDLIGQGYGLSTQKLQ